MAYFLKCFIFQATESSWFSSNEINWVGDAMIGNPFLPVALFPDWLLPQRQQREPLSGQKQTPASGPEGRGSAVAVSLPQTLNPGSKTKVAH